MAWPEFDPYLKDAAVAGALGGIVRWIRLKEPWKEGLLTVFVGAITSKYLYPFALFVLDPVLAVVADDQDARIGIAGFITGTMGVVMVGLVIDFIKAKTKGSLK